MVSIRQIHKDAEQFDLDQWLNSLDFDDPKKKDALKAFIHQSHEQFQQDDIAPQTCEMLEILIDLGMDLETLNATVLFSLSESSDVDDETLEKQYGTSLFKLVKGVRQMEAIRSLHNQSRSPASKVDNVRRMLLAMVDDVRAVVIKLAERVCFLRNVKEADEETRVLAAKETESIYSPLANRLGIGQIKWELEDLSFRYLHPNTYKEIAKLLDEKRLDREGYIDQFVEDLNEALSKENVKAKVYGRPKHIYSIWRKMQKKRLSFTELYDIRAVRIIADRLQDCYGALGVVHTRWKHIPKEFDDYVANPKPNGYQSIHTVILGPEGKIIEIQIRTEQMHQDAELGVAAHWKYKEGGGHSKDSYDEKINWLRKILQWQEEVAESGDLVEELRNQVFEDRVYIFTPTGDVIDLPAGSTPLDFAYYIHSNVGHRCIGAKVFGKIVPFTHQLQTGDQVEILTAKEPNPSRDWLNPNLGYVNSSRARSKILTWFKKLDRDKNIIAGKEVLETELNRANLKLKDIELALTRFNVASTDDLLAGVGGGDIRVNQVVNFLQNQLCEEPEDTKPKVFNRALQSKKPSKDSIVIQGVGNLMTFMAGCCKPVPGDDIAGYITVGRGISVHRNECDQVKKLLEANPERQVNVEWGEDVTGGYRVPIRVTSNERSSLVRDITNVLANEKVNLLSLNNKVKTKNLTSVVEFEIELLNLESLTRLLSKLSQLDGVQEVKRL